jgi:hypothetical protein
MGLKTYCLFDNKAEAYNQPMFFVSEEMAIECLKRFLNSSEWENINPVDYDLFYLGEYNFDNGKFDLLSAPKHMLNLRKLENKGKNNG